MNPDLQKQNPTPEPLSDEQKRLLAWLNLPIELVSGAISRSKTTPPTGPDWHDVTKKSLAQTTAAIMSQQHQAVTGVATKSISKKSLGNKAILKEISGIRENLNQSLASLHQRINKLEARQDLDRRQAQIMWIILMYCMESGQLQIPSNTELSGWLLSRIERGDPAFMAMANNLSELIVQAVLGEHLEVSQAAANFAEKIMPNGGQFGKFAPGAGLDNTNKK